MPRGDWGEVEEPAERRRAAGGVEDWGRNRSSVNDPKGSQFEIKIDGIVRTHRDVREYAIEAARNLQQRNPGAKILITDLRDGSVVPLDWP